jgi:hypothetical protein
VCDVYGKEGCIAHNYHYHKTIPSRGMFRNIVEENQKKKDEGVVEVEDI